FPAKIIYNGVDLQRLRPTKTRREIRRDWQAADDTKFVGYVGRFAAEKNPLAVVQAVASLPLNYRAVLVGQCTEPYRSEAERLLPSRTLFLGHVDDIGNV